MPRCCRSQDRGGRTEGRKGGERVDVPKPPRSFLQSLIGKEIHLNFARPEAAAAQGVLLGFDELGVLVSRAERSIFIPWHVLRSIDAVSPD